MAPRDSHFLRSHLPTLGMAGRDHASQADVDNLGVFWSRKRVGYQLPLFQNCELNRPRISYYGPWGTWRTGEAPCILYSILLFTRKSKYSRFFLCFSFMRERCTQIKHLRAGICVREQFSVRSWSDSRLSPVFQPYYPNNYSGAHCHLPPALFGAALSLHSTGRVCCHQLYP